MRQLLPKLLKLIATDHDTAFGYLLRLMALRLGCDGLLNHPAHFHNAQLYGRFFNFVDPEVEGRFRALERDLAHLSLADATVAEIDFVPLRGSYRFLPWPDRAVSPFAGGGLGVLGYDASVEGPGVFESETASLSAIEPVVGA